MKQTGGTFCHSISMHVTPLITAAERRKAGMTPDFYEDLQGELESGPKAILAGAVGTANNVYKMTLAKPVHAE